MGSKNPPPPRGATPSNSELPERIDIPDDLPPLSEMLDAIEKDDPGFLERLKAAHSQEGGETPDENNDEDTGDPALIDEVVEDLLLLAAGCMALGFTCNPALMDDQGEITVASVFAAAEIDPVLCFMLQGELAEENAEEARLENDESSDDDHTPLDQDFEDPVACGEALVEAAYQRLRERLKNHGPFTIAYGDMPEMTEAYPGFGDHVERRLAIMDAVIRGDIERIKTIMTTVYSDGTGAGMAPMHVLAVLRGDLTLIDLLVTLDKDEDFESAWRMMAIVLSPDESARYAEKVLKANFVRDQRQG